MNRATDFSVAAVTRRAVPAGSRPDGGQLPTKGKRPFRGRVAVYTPLAPTTTVPFMFDSSFDPESGFNGLLGLDWRHVGGDRVVAGIRVTDQLKQPYGIVHGGLYCSVIEAVCSVGAASWGFGHGVEGVVGVSNTTDFLRAHREGDLEAVATPVYQGRTYQIWQAIVRRDSDDKPVARGQLRVQHIDDPQNVGRTDRGVEGGDERIA